MSQPRRVCSESGTSLIELIVAVAIMGIAFVAILGGIGTAIIGADSQRRDATGGLVLTTAAETILAAERPYIPCADPSAYGVPVSPPGFIVTVERVAFWNPTENEFVRFETRDACLGKDNGLQLLELSIVSTGGPRLGSVERLEIVKRQVDT